MGKINSKLGGGSSVEDEKKKLLVKNPILKTMNMNKRVDSM
jgi:hypothetical protein